MTWQYSPYEIPLGISAGVSIVLAVLAWRRQHTPGSIAFMWLMLAVTVWSVFALLEHASADLASKLTWAKLTYTGIGLLLLSWPSFVLHFTGRAHWLTRRNLLLLAIDPIAIVLFTFTNELHGLVWPTVALVDHGSVAVMVTDHGPIFWIHAVYGYLVMLSCTILIVRFLRRSPLLYREQAMAMLIATIVPWIGNILFLSGNTPVDVTPIAFMITGLAGAWGLLRFRLLDIVPVARDAVIESMVDGVLALDTQNRIVDTNLAARRLLASGTKEVIGQPATTLLPALSKLLDGRDEALEKQAELALSVASSERYFELRVTPLFDRTKRLGGRVVVLHDITERKQAAERIQTQNEALSKANKELDEAREQAESATRLKSQFLATMSHELRTPLNSVIGYTEIMLAGMTGELTEQQIDYQTRVLSNAEHLLKLINEVLDLSRIEAGRTEIVRKPFQVQNWYQEVIRQTEGLVQQKGLKFECKLDERLPADLVGDPARLKQVVINLLSNAVKFTEAGYVRMEVRKHGDDTWTLAVSDSGIGIAPHMQEMIFEEFRQVDEKSTRKYGGTGLGLAIVRRLVLAMGGTIRVTSQLETGSTFTVFLPLVQADIPPVPDATTVSAP